MGCYGYCGDGGRKEPSSANRIPPSLRFVRSIAELESLKTFEDKMRFLGNFLPRAHYNIKNFQPKLFDSKENFYSFKALSLTREHFHDFRQSFASISPTPFAELFLLEYLVFVDESVTFCCSPFDQANNRPF